MPRSIPTTARWPSPSRMPWCFPADTDTDRRRGAAGQPRRACPTCRAALARTCPAAPSRSQGGLVIGLTRLNRILAIEPEGRYAVVQAGVTNLELQQALAPRGFLFAPDPASQKAATLGGNLAENAGGPHCVKYGVTTNHVLGMTAVLPGGEVLQIGGPALDPPGYDLRGVLVGSEGTLAVVTEMVVRILPVGRIAADHAGGLRRRGGRGPLGLGDRRGGHDPGDAGDDGRGRDPRGRGQQALRLSAGRRGRPDRRGGRPAGRSGPAGRAHRPVVPAERLPRGPQGEGCGRTRPAVGRPAGRVRRDRPAGSQFPRGRLHGAAHAPAGRLGPGRRRSPTAISWATPTCSMPATAICTR